MKPLLPKKKFAQLRREGQHQAERFSHPPFVETHHTLKPIRKEEQFSEQETFCNRIKNEGLSTRLAAQQPRARPPPNSGDLLIRSLL